MLCLSLTTTNSGTSSASFSLVETENGNADGDTECLTYRPDFFYLTFMLASSYVGMVLTAWGLNKVDQGQFGVDKGWASTWAKVAASWVTAILYTWSLIAHKILTSRRF
jgi:serine incorporator 1/3